MLATDGYTYEKRAIEKWLLENNTSPKNNLSFDAKDLRPNHAIKSMIDLFKQEEKGWKNLKTIEKKFLYVYTPKVREMLNQEVVNLEKNAAKKILSNWEANIDLSKEKEEILRRQLELNAYSIKDNKYKFQIPQPIQAFVGRERELENIDKILKRENVVCLVGSGGMGKTQLATEYIMQKAQ